MKRKSFSLLSLFLLSASLISCKHPKDQKLTGTTGKTFVQKFNSKSEDAILLLSCIVFAQETNRGLNMDSLGGFYKINTLLGDYSAYPANLNIDSSIDVFILASKNVDFTSKNAYRRISIYKESYHIVSDIIFGAIEDDKEFEAQILEAKIDKTPEVSKIYRSYVEKGRKLNSLSSSEGSALFIHLAYYFSLLDSRKRNEILKALL